MAIVGTDLEICKMEILHILNKYRCIICDLDGSEFFIYIKDEDTGEKEEL